MTAIAVIHAIPLPPVAMCQRTTIGEPILESFCRLYLQNWSVRKLAARFGLPRSTIHYWIVKRLGKGAEREPKSGLLPIFEEHLAGISSRQREEVRQWIAQNSDAILQSDRAHAGTRLLTDHEERGLGWQETHAKRDFRYVLDEVCWREFGAGCRDRSTRKQPT